MEKENDDDMSVWDAIEEDDGSDELIAHLL